MNISINKDKSIGKVLYIVEGDKTEPFILTRIFSHIFDYNIQVIKRNGRYYKYASSSNPNSRVFVINSEESNISYIKKDNEYLNNLFRVLIEDYDFDVDNSAIYYVFDRDNHSNTDTNFIIELIQSLGNSRENDNYLRQGMLLLSYPSIEAFTFSNYTYNSFNAKIDTGKELKQLLNDYKYNQSKIDEHTLSSAVKELFSAFDKMHIDNYNLDRFSNCNLTIFNYEEKHYKKYNTYRILSLICISLLDLGLIEIL